VRVSALTGVSAPQVSELRDICKRLGLSEAGRSYELKDRLAGLLAVHSAAAKGNEAALMAKVGAA
jgi:hypothetical protein